MIPLQALVAAGHDVRLVVSRADKKRGRGNALVPSPVKAAAVELGLPVTSSLDAVAEADVELGVVVAFGRILPADLLARVPMVNLHFSLLPRWRGAAPVERAILAGDAETGVCLMKIDEGLDTGPVIRCQSLAIGPEETADELRGRLVAAGTEVLLTQLEVGLSPARPQTGEPTYADKISPDELRIDWSDDLDAMHRLIRLGRAWTLFRGHRIRILRAVRSLDPAARSLAPGQLDGVLVGPGLELVEVQPEGKRPQPAMAWVQGARLRPGERFGS
ncbi:MAG: methionyl-tRNA formyltransferase [Actinomycetota bacterium]|nr:methionyl-tRNA formyltransferase [Actinomycetota bacterium]